MSLFFSALGFLLFLLTLGVAFYLITARRYQSSHSVANSYDQWTEDGILEFYWGEHIHEWSLWFAAATEGFSGRQS